jgi:hypothetical protein
MVHYAEKHAHTSVVIVLSSIFFLGRTITHVQLVCRFSSCDMIERECLLWLVTDDVAVLE